MCVGAKGLGPSLGQWGVCIMENRGLKIICIGSGMVRYGTRHGSGKLGICVDRFAVRTRKRKQFWGAEGNTVLLKLECNFTSYPTVAFVEAFVEGILCCLNVCVHGDFIGIADSTDLARK